MSQTLLYKLDNLIEGIVIKRPSKYIKSPYVADINCSDFLIVSLLYTNYFGVLLIGLYPLIR